MTGPMIAAGLIVVVACVAVFAATHPDCLKKFLDNWDAMLQYEDMETNTTTHEDLPTHHADGSLAGLPFDRWMASANGRVSAHAHGLRVDLTLARAQALADQYDVAIRICWGGSVEATGMDTMWVQPNPADHRPHGHPSRHAEDAHEGRV